MSTVTFQQTTISKRQNCVARYAVAFAWSVNAALLIAAGSWIFYIGSSIRTIERMGRELRIGQPHYAFVIRDDARRDITVTVAEVAAVIAAVTFLVMLVSLFVGGQRFRTTRMWLVFTAISCGWLGLAMTWPEIYWRGQMRRVRAHIPAAEIVLKRLQADWPKADGEIAGLGPFQAYPIKRPTALVPLRMTNLLGTSQQFTLVERSATGVIRFELGDNELGAWLEWRPDDSPPATFAGGLGTQYNMRRYARLAPHWCLVRYQRSGNSMQHTPTDPMKERARDGVAIRAIASCPT